MQKQNYLVTLGGVSLAAYMLVAAAKVPGFYHGAVAAAGSTAGATLHAAVLQQHYGSDVVEQSAQRWQQEREAPQRTANSWEERRPQYVPSYEEKQYQVRESQRGLERAVVQRRIWDRPERYEIYAGFPRAAKRGYTAEELPYVVWQNIEGNRYAARHCAVPRSPREQARLQRSLERQRLREKLRAAAPADEEVLPHEDDVNAALERMEAARAEEIGDRRAGRRIDEALKTIRERMPARVTP